MPDDELSLDLIGHLSWRDPPLPEPAQRPMRGEIILTPQMVAAGRRHLAGLVCGDNVHCACVPDPDLLAEDIIRDALEAAGYRALPDRR